MLLYEDGKHILQNLKLEDDAQERQLPVNPTRWVYKMEGKTKKRSCLS